MVPIRVLVVDDYRPWRLFVSSALQRRPELVIVGEVSDGLEAIQKAQELQPDLIMLDVGLPKPNGIEVARRLRRISPRGLSPSNACHACATMTSCPKSLNETPAPHAVASFCASAVPFHVPFFSDTFVIKPFSRVIAFAQGKKPLHV